MDSTINLMGVLPSRRTEIRQGLRYFNRPQKPCKKELPSPPQELLELSTLTSVSEQNSKHLGFLNVLPREIRDWIYEYVLGGMTVLFETRDTTCDDCGNLEAHPNAYQCVAREASSDLVLDLALDLALLRVCSQIYKEARFVPFSANEFKIPCRWKELTQLVQDLVSNQYRAITSLHLEDLTLDLLHKGADVISEMPNLKRLKLDLDLDWTTRTKKSTKELLEALEKDFCSLGFGELTLPRLEVFELTLDLTVFVDDLAFFEKNMEDMRVWLKDKRLSLLPPTTSKDSC